jgi:hypothetical protein
VLQTADGAGRPHSELLTINYLTGAQSNVSLPPATIVQATYSYETDCIVAYDVNDDVLCINYRDGSNKTIINNLAGADANMAFKGFVTSNEGGSSAAGSLFAIIYHHDSREGQYDLLMYAVSLF